MEASSLFFGFESYFLVFFYFNFSFMFFKLDLGNEFGIN